MVYGSANMSMASKNSSGTGATEGSGKKKKRSDNVNCTMATTKKQGNRKKPKPNIIDAFQDLRANIKDSMDNRLNMLKHTISDKLGCSITEVMYDIINLLGIVLYSHLHIFTRRIMIDKSKREMYIAYKTPEVKLTYLQMEC